MKVFASCMSYVLGQMTSPREATTLITYAVSEPRAEQVLPAVHALRELRGLADVQLMADGGASHLAKARSRHFAAALESDCDAWLAIDDDTDTTRDTLAVMLAAVSDDVARICIAPCLLRESDVANVEWSPVYLERTVYPELAPAGILRRAVRGGFGLVVMNRAALTEIAALVPSFRDVDGKLKPAAFLEFLKPDGRWFGEDMAFFERIRVSKIVIEGLTTGETTHAGTRLDLGILK